MGDDVYGEDPTINELEKESALMTGQEAALFVTSGTQGNVAALLTHCSRGDGAILGSDSHIYIYEGGGLSALGGILPLVADDPGGIIPPDRVLSWCRPSNVHFAPARLLCVENTHNRAEGQPSPEDFKATVAARSRLVPRQRQGLQRLHRLGHRRDGVHGIVDSPSPFKRASGPCSMLCGGAELTRAQEARRRPGAGRYWPRRGS